METPGSSRLLILAMQVLLHTCHSPILIRLTRLLVQEEDIVLLLRPLDLVALLFGRGTDYWSSELRFQSSRMDSLVEYWLIVEHGVVPGTMGLGCFSQPIVSSPGSAPQAECVDPLLGSSPGGSS
ncbi:uncharacterized protein EURHEDRAFT_410677 [Aspergillus ruber CBS 135680]|uniref:Uncharacterized protein n=1 Tax=Aspergillus ruber (strain CBS 135680) TaxID=1388766 RepID=A0A017SKN2_ASPRC|nr:uncharacterized protein EURHEDRAFT_410677 [Aspergillus ruber CBS 135680]EYE96880.1 hypothetical protein EURHEDRAFT_410677 [Aspergillus ruber CBS 135680]